MNNINAIPIFVAVAETGGFSSAANELGLSKSAISKRIGQLEDQLGVRLFHRSTRKISLTEAGEPYLMVWTTNYPASKCYIVVIHKRHN